jgi:cytidylate kinase
LKEKGLNVTLSSLLREIQARDERDANRKVAPLKPASGALIVDTTGMPVADVIRKVLAVVRANG